MQNNGIGDLFKSLRIEKGVSLGEVEEKTGISRSYVCKLENNVRENPSLYSLSKLTNFYGIPLSTIEEVYNNGSNSTGGQVQNLDMLLMSQKYNFASIEASVEFRVLLRKLILRLEEYSTKSIVTRIDEVDLMEVIDEIRSKMLETA